MTRTWFIIIGFLYMVSTATAQGTGGSGGGDHIMHKQELHQYIVQEAYKILQQIAPHQAAKLHDHIGTMSTPSAPWEEETISAGSHREDEEDILYGYGGWYYEWDPDIDMAFPTSVCPGYIHYEIEDGLRNDWHFRNGLITTSHFWDPGAQDPFLRGGYSVFGTGIMDCIDGLFQTPPGFVLVTVKPMYNALQKATTLLGSTMQMPIKDFWTSAAIGPFHNPDQNYYLSFPSPKPNSGYLQIGYQSLARLYNFGECWMVYHDQASGAPSWLSTPYELTHEQRNRYVWEILGRVCHLLTDMSVPAHTHKDTHATNESISTPIEVLGTPVGLLRTLILDADSYEQWIAHAGNGQTGNLSNIYWNAAMILADVANPPFIDPGNPQNPLAALSYLMTEMRLKAAAFASDDYDGTGLVDPNEKTDFPVRHDVTEDPTNQTQLGMLMTIRTATIPYCIRAVAGLLYWFANEIDMPVQDFQVLNSGTEPPPDFFYRTNPSGNIYSSALSPAPFSRSAGDDMFLRSHYELTGQTQNSKFFSWSSDRHEPTAQHQRDFIVMENNGDSTLSTMQPKRMTSRTSPYGSKGPQ